MCDQNSELNVEAQKYKVLDSACLASIESIGDLVAFRGECSVNFCTSGLNMMTCQGPAALGSVWEVENWRDTAHNKRCFE